MFASFFCFIYSIPVKLQKTRYLVEFRDIFPQFRFKELLQIYQDTLNVNFKRTNILKDHSSYMSNEFLDIQNVISDCKLINTNISNQYHEKSVCIYMNFPNEDFAVQVAKKSGLIRSIVEVYGDGHDPITTCQNAIEFNRSNPNKINTKFLFNPLFSPSQNSWRINFRRYGRQGKSGLDYEGKRQRLEIFRPFLMNLYGDVDLIKPVHELIYLEDWHDWHDVEISKSKQKDIASMSSS